jgi:DnaJ-class molecular chaperone
MDSNPYDTLGVKANASQDEIKNAYRSLAKKLHPDLNPGNKTAEKKFKEVNAAYEAVGTADERAKYDRGESEAQAQAEAQARANARYGQGGTRGGRTQGNPFYYETQGGEGAGTGRYSQFFNGMDDDVFGQAMNRDETYQMSIDLKDAVLGTEKEITLPSGTKLRVKIPAGIDTGKKLRFSGMGTASADVYIEIKVIPSPVFTRDGNHLEIEIPISAAESIMGAEIKVPTLDGFVSMKVPPSVSSGQKLRIAGKGVPGKGDQLVKIKIVNPDPKSALFDEELKNAISEWSKRHPFNPRPNL